MEKQKYQKRLFRSNKYRKRILSIVLLPTIIICLLISFLILLFHLELVSVILYGEGSLSLEAINQWSFIIVFVLWLIFIIVYIRVHIVSSQLVGAFERIMNEMDEVIGNKEKKELKAREKDDLANELLKRINLLIDGYRGSRGPS